MGLLTVLANITNYDVDVLYICLPSFLDSLEKGLKLFVVS